MPSLVRFSDVEGVEYDRIAEDESPMRAVANDSNHCRGSKRLEWRSGRQWDGRDSRLNCHARLWVEDVGFNREYSERGSDVP